MDFPSLKFLSRIKDKGQSIMLTNREQAQNFVKNIMMKNFSSIQEILNHIKDLPEINGCVIKEANLSSLPLGLIEVDIWQQIVSKQPKLKLGKKFLFLEFSNRNSILFIEHCFTDPSLNEIQIQIDFDDKQDLVKKFELFFHHVNEMQTLNNMSVELATYFVKYSKYQDEL